MSTFLEKNARLVSREDFVRTYNPRSHTDPVDLLEEYSHVIEYALTHPGQSSQTIATNLDLPQHRVKRWINHEDPVIPRSIRGLEAAERNGWISIDVNSETFQGLNILVAACFVTGNITPRSWDPTFSIPNTTSLQRMIMAMKWIGAEYELKRESNRSPISEITVSTSPSVLGRVLYVLGAPLENTPGEAIHLPTYIDRIGHEHREAFVKTYLKSQDIDPGNSETLELDASMNDYFLDQLRDLVEDVSGTEIDCDGNCLLIPEHSAKSLGLG